MRSFEVQGPMDAFDRSGFVSASESRTVPNPDVKADQVRDIQAPLRDGADWSGEHGSQDGDPGTRVMRLDLMGPASRTRSPVSTVTYLAPISTSGPPSGIVQGQNSLMSRNPAHRVRDGRTNSRVPRRPRGQNHRSAAGQQKGGRRSGQGRTGWSVRDDRVSR